MKKLLVMITLMIATLGFSQSTSVQNSQEATRTGNYMVGVKTTGLGFTNVQDVTRVDVGLEGGVFVADRLALVGSTGYQSLNSKYFQDQNNWMYGLGAKYYIADMFPLQVDWNGATGNSYNPSASFVGTQLGYAWFPYKNFSIEPRLRYDFSTDRTRYENVFSGGVGFGLHF